MRIAAVGDSVMWGQGLMPPLSARHFENEEKYVFKVVEWLQKIGKVQEIDMADFLAHSGAKIGSKTDPFLPPRLTRENADNKKEYDNYYGEVPDRNPSVLSQLKKLRNGHTIDLLLINGGPNDVEITESLSSPGDFYIALKKIDRVAELRVSYLLVNARKVCPNAIIIYTGYYPALSPKSDIPVGVSLNEITLATSPLIGLQGGLVFISETLVRTQFPRIKRQGVEFHLRILARFREQIAQFNTKHDPSSPPILFCPSLFNSSNAMWANDEMVFSIARNPNPSVFAPRKKLCGQVFKDVSYELIEPFNPQKNIEIISDHLICENAYVGHPNKKGAEQYYKELKKRIEVQLNFSLRNHFKTMDTQVLSIRKLNEKYPFIPSSSLRRISDLLWLDVISIGYHINGYAGPTRDFLSTLYFDFGWGYQMASNQNGIFILDIMGRKKLGSLKFVKIRLPGFKGTIYKLSIDFYIKINGYSLPFIALTERSFQKSGDDWVWEMPTLNFKPENA
jgi:hypothetical protein